LIGIKRKAKKKTITSTKNGTKITQNCKLTTPSIDFNGQKFHPVSSQHSRHFSRNHLPNLVSTNSIYNALFRRENRLSTTV